MIEHNDHAMSDDQRAWALEQFALLPEGFHVETFELPSRLGMVYCGLYGPIMGDDPVNEDDAMYLRRSEDRPLSRCVNRPMRPSRLLTVVGIRSDEGDTVFTMYGGPAAPREPGDPHFTSASEYWEAVETWRDHALVAEPHFVIPSGEPNGPTWASVYFAPRWNVQESA